jgi:hypothetical protein
MTGTIELPVERKDGMGVASAIEPEDKTFRRVFGLSCLWEANGVWGTLPLDECCFAETE